MGGIGSGNHYQSGKPTTDDYRALDIRWLKREGLLSSGLGRHVHWYTNGEETGSIQIHAQRGRIVLDYRCRERGGEWWAERYPVQIVTTPCHLGGERDWFLCPARGCSRKVAILYGGAIFACRHCHGLAYRSQREGRDDRAARRAIRVREKLGWPGGFLDGTGWGKPKGMHWRTYHRLIQRHDAHSRVAMRGVHEQIQWLKGLV